jgi:hypothetical protein
METSKDINEGYSWWMLSRERQKTFVTKEEHLFFK